MEIKQTVLQPFGPREESGSNGSLWSMGGGIIGSPTPPPVTSVFDLSIDYRPTIIDNGWFRFQNLDLGDARLTTLSIANNNGLAGKNIAFSNDLSGILNGGSSSVLISPVAGQNYIITESSIFSGMGGTTNVDVKWSPVGSNFNAGNFSLGTVAFTY
jgi:hypothetical protein